MADIRRRPLWVDNLLVFGFLFGACLFYFWWQIAQAREDFMQEAETHAQMMARVIRLSASGALLAREAAEDILRTFLGNTCRFVGFLDEVEPFHTGELAAFAEEAGLRGISINRGQAQSVEGPQGWSAGLNTTCEAINGLDYLEEQHLYTFRLLDREGKRCITVGVGAEKLERLQEQLGLPNMLKNLAALPGIAYVRVTPSAASQAGGQTQPQTGLTAEDGLQIARVALPLGGETLLVGLDARNLTATLKRLWRDFLVFAAVLAVMGISLSWILFRFQKAHVRQIRAYERQLGVERQDAALGRAAAFIAHEIRNPLNAIGMGLQRLQLESPAMREQDGRLLDLMSQALVRANRTVTDLLAYVHPKQIKTAAVDLEKLLQDLLDLYRPQLNRVGLGVTERGKIQKSVAGDPHLLTQVFENLLRNAIEAQSGEGFIQLEKSDADGKGCLKISNGGERFSFEDTERMLEPYYTTKPDGNGLGLPLSRKIIEAHRGHLEIHPREAGGIQVTVSLPLWPQNGSETTRGEKGDA